MNLTFNFEGESDEPVTRGEFAEAMQILASAFAQVVTKSDVERFATKDNIQRIERRMAADKREMLRQIQASLEITRDALLGAHAGRDLGHAGAPGRPRG